MTSGPDVGRVTAVIVNYNSGHHLTRCVASLRAAGITGIRVADNGSRDDSLAQMLAADPDVEIVETGANLGYGGGANRGVAGATTDYVLVLNADVRIDPAAPAALVAVLDGHPDAGLVGMRIENEDGTLYPSARTFPDFVDAVGHAAFGLIWPNNPYTRRYRMLDWDHADAAPVDWVSGACFLARREVFAGVGGFDESYFMYLEDVDLCWRIWRAGWEVRYEPGASVVHVQGVSTDQTPYRMLAAHHRSMLRFARRTTVGRRRRLLPIVVAGLGGRLVVACAQRAFRGRRRPLPKSVVPADMGAGGGCPAAPGRTAVNR